MESTPDVPNARFWFASVAIEGGLSAGIFLECERWFDARRVAQVVLSQTKVVIGPALDPASMRKLPEPRYQVRWVGLAARRVPDHRIQIRLIDPQGKVGAWKDL